MSDLKEIDEPVEKAGKVTFRGKRMSRAARRKLATGAAPARAIPRHASAIRFAHRLRKSADPLAAFDAAIEKARAILPKGAGQ